MLYKSKVVGLGHYAVKEKVEEGDYLILVKDLNNPYDKNAIRVLNGERDTVGYLANSENTLSINNVKNGNLPAKVINYVLDLSNKEYYAEVISSYSSCIYVLINDGKWSSI